MLLSLSSLLFACIVYQYCFNDDLSFFTYFSSAEPSETFSRLSRPNWDQFSSAVPEVMSYGTWRSPIQSSLIVENVVQPMEIQVDEKGNVYWLELRPSEAGRYVLRSNRSTKDLVGKSSNCRTRVHEYGGGSYIVNNDTAYFVNFLDQRIYRIDLNGDENEAKEFSRESTGASLRYADFHLDSVHQQLISVHENHQNESEVRNSIVALSLADGSAMVTLTEGFDFYSSPRVSPDGQHLIWICWNHPNMPWDQTELWIADISSSESKFSLVNQRKLFGNIDESIIQPSWSPDGKFIYFISDRNNWWNIYRSSIDGQTLEHICDMDAEFGGPAWQFGASFYDFDSNGNLVAAYSKEVTKLVRIDVQTKKLTSITATEIYTDIRSVHVHDENVYFIGSSATKPAEVVHLNLKNASIEVLLRSTEMKVDLRYLSIPETIKFKSGNAFAYGLYYPPKNDDYQFPNSSDELPPLLVRTHGGPTSATSSAFNLRIQYWTSRGFALLDVNYRGSTGYGRKYRDSLKDNWGLYDVEDCVSGAQHLVEQNKVDRNRVTIDGGSAGGYTTLCALTMTNYFSAGASHYGVSDLETLARDTHKFESRYLDRLIGEYPAKKDVYQARSPIHHIENLSKPIIFFQGTEDKIVLPSQAESMVNALRQKKLPVAYVLFEGEQHGFRKAENIRKSLDGQFYFFSRIFGFQMADEVEPIPIENFD